jgi:prevent-host-death family protein
MEKVVSAAEANRQFSRLLRSVRDGNTYVVTTHGKPVARIVPIGNDEDRVADAAWKALFERLDAQPAVEGGRWTRDELYEDEP